MSFNPHLPALLHPGVSRSNAICNSLCCQQLHATSHVDYSSQIFFAEIFQIPFGKRPLRRYSDLTLASFNGYNPSAEIPSFSIHFDSLLKKVLKVGSVHDSIFYGVSAVKGKFHNLLLFLPHFATSFFTGASATAEAERLFTFSLSLKYFLISSVVSFLSHGLLRNFFFNFQIFVNFPNFILLLISSLIFMQLVNISKFL